MVASSSFPNSTHGFQLLANYLQVTQTQTWMSQQEVQYTDREAASLPLHQQIHLCSLSLFCCLCQSNTPPPGLSSCARIPRRRCWQQEWLLGSWGWYHDRGPAHLHGIWCIWTVPPWSTWVSPQWRLKEEEWWRLHRFIEVVVCL